MAEATSLNWRVRFLIIVTVATAFFFISLQQTAAQNGKCQVGTKVQGDMGGGKAGTIAEIGTESPHVGWYRIVFDWNAPRGDWYDPRTWQIRIAGTDSRCGQASAAETKRHRDETGEAPQSAQNSTCEFYKSYKKVSNNAPPSAELFKGVIFEWFESINKYRDFGLVFVDFKMGKSYKNSARGNGRKDVDPAPVGATIYPLKTKLVLCEKDIESTYRTEWVNEYACYKNRVGEWVCKNAAPQQYKRTSFLNK